MYKKFFGLFTIVAAVIFVSCQNPMIKAVGSSASAPLVSVVTSADTYSVGSYAKLTATAFAIDGGSLSYQWYSVADDTDTAIPDATSKVYVSQEGREGTYTYAVIVTNTLNGTTNSTRSEDVEITVTKKTSGGEEGADETHAAMPVITALETKSYDYVTGETGATITINATVTDNGNAKAGTLSYQWYCGNEAIANENSNTFTIPTTEAGNFTYSCKVTNTYESATAADGKTASATSETITVTVTEPVITNAATPVFSTNPAGKIYTEGDTIDALTVVATSATSGTSLAGTISYQWYSNTSASNAGGTAIEGANSASLSITETTKGSYYYFCEATNTATEATGTKTASARSTVATIKIVGADETHAAMPVITALETKSYDYVTGATGATIPINATVTDNGNAKKGDVSYQWYCNDEAIANANTDSFTIPTASAGTFTYYCKVTNTYESATAADGKTASANSDTITVTVTDPVTNAGAVTITTNPANATYTQGASADALSVAADVAESATEIRGTISYQWYKSTTSVDAGFSVINGATESTYTPDTTVAGTFYYYCVVTNTANNATENKKEIATSAPATITVNASTGSGGISIDFN